MKKKENKMNKKSLFIDIVCFIFGVFIGYLCAVCIENNAHRTSYVSLCNDGSKPDSNGCCPGETYTDLGDLGFNCCPEGDGDCYPPIR